MDFKERYQYNPKTDLLGKGGFARVFKAYDQIMQRNVALKVFSVEVSEKYDLVSEIRRVWHLEHPNLCRYYDVAFLEGVTIMGEEEKLQVGIMEYLDGGDLKTYCNQHPEHRVKLLIDVLHGLAFLHKRSIIHRDLKPANILVKSTEDGPVAKITDFGISKEAGRSITSSSQLLGSLEYMAPEQFNPDKYAINKEISTQLDLWSFGILVYEIITGESMFGSRGSITTQQVINNILNEDLASNKINQLHEPYKNLVKRCLVKDVRQRARTADELIFILAGKETTHSSNDVNKETVVIPKPIVSSPQTTPIAYKEKPSQGSPINQEIEQKRTDKKGLIAATLVLLVILVVGVIWWNQRLKTGNNAMGTAPIDNPNNKLYPVMDKATRLWGFADISGKPV